MVSEASWPNDADGDVFRRLEAHGFDFDKPHTVDYNVDFASWPPNPEALEFLRAQYGVVKVYEPDENGDGYVQFRVMGAVSYEGVTGVQRRTTLAMRRYGGVCESWGVLQEPRASA
jgi:hypothetical protein